MIATGMMCSRSASEAWPTSYPVGATPATAARMAGTWWSAAFEPGSPAVRAALNRTARRRAREQLDRLTGREREVA